MRFGRKKSRCIVDGHANVVGLCWLVALAHGAPTILKLVQQQPVRSSARTPASAVRADDHSPFPGDNNEIAARSNNSTLSNGDQGENNNSSSVGYGFANAKPFESSHEQPRKVEEKASSGIFRSLFSDEVANSRPSSKVPVATNRNKYIAKSKNHNQASKSVLNPRISAFFHNHKLDSTFPPTYKPALLWLTNMGNRRRPSNLVIPLVLASTAIHVCRSEPIRRSVYFWRKMGPIIVHYKCKLEPENYVFLHCHPYILTLQHLVVWALSRTVVGAEKVSP
jgi:hypothetical protein